MIVSKRQQAQSKARRAEIAEEIKKYLAENCKQAEIGTVLLVRLGRSPNGVSMLRAMADERLIAYKHGIAGLTEKACLKYLPVWRAWERERVRLRKGKTRQSTGAARRVQAPEPTKPIPPQEMRKREDVLLAWQRKNGKIRLYL